MFHFRKQNLVAAMNIFMPPSPDDQVDGFGCPARENDFFSVSGVEKLLYLVADPFVKVGGFLGERMNAAVHVGIVPAVKIIHRANHGLGFLRRRGVVEVDEPLAVYLAFEDGKLSFEHVLLFLSLRGACDEAIFGRLPRSLRSLAMTIIYILPVAQAIDESGEKC